MVPKEIGKTSDLEDISFQLKSFLSENELVAEIWGAIPVDVLDNKGELNFLFTTWAHNKPKEYLVLYPLFVDLLRDQFNINCKLTIVVNDLLPPIIENRSPQEQQLITDLYLHFFGLLGVSNVRLCSQENYDIDFAEYLRWARALKLQRLVNRYLPQSKRGDINLMKLGDVTKEAYHLLSEIKIYSSYQVDIVLAGIGGWGVALGYQELAKELNLPERCFIFLKKTNDTIQTLDQLKSLSSEAYRNSCTHALKMIAQMKEDGLLK